MTSKGRGHASQNLQITWQGHVKMQFTAVEVRLKRASTGPHYLAEMVQVATRRASKGPHDVPEMVRLAMIRASTGPQRTSLPGRNGTGCHEEGLWLCEAANVQLAWLRKTL